ncbi:Multiple RNA-binding domain-containing protein 1 [Lecanora helva]
MDYSRIFVRGLPPNLSADEFKNHFSSRFPTTDAKFIPHRRIGYIGYKTPEDAAKAVKYYNKSFIRMSRVGVEVARPVQEGHCQKPIHKSLGSTKVDKANNSTSSVTVPSNAQNQDQHHPNRNTETGAKLNEFLDVMRPPAKSKIWEDRTAIAEVPSEQVAECSDDHVASVKDHEIQEPWRKRQKLSHETGPKVDQPDQPAQHNDDVRVGADVTSNKENEHGVSIDAETPSAPAQAQSDSDWLRSRSSRLLGLVDDDDVHAPAAPSNYDETAMIATTRPPAQMPPEHEPNAIEDTRGKDCDEHTIESVPPSEAQESTIDHGRLFIRNLSYSTTEDELREFLEGGNYGAIEELRLPFNFQNDQNKGFAHVQFVEADAAARAISDLNQKSFQGRLLQVMPANAKKQQNLDEFTISKMPLKKQQQIRRRAEAATSTFNWNSMYINTDAVMSSIADRLGILKSDLLDPTSSDAAVKQAHAETHIIQEIRSYFTAHGVDLNAFQRKVRGDKAILIKNFAYGTRIEELRDLFEPHGYIRRLLMPPSGTIAIVEFDQVEHARSAFSDLAYRKFKDSVLFLEKAPKDLFRTTNETETQSPRGNESTLRAKDLLKKDGVSGSVDASTLFVRNLNFVTTTERLNETFQPLDGFLSARVKNKPDPKKAGQFLSMGFGFLEFQTKANAEAALQAMNDYELDGHKLVIQVSHRVVDAAEERRTANHIMKNASRKTKIIIKNLPFQASKKDVRSLFGSYGQLRSVRMPKKLDSSTRGFAFAEFVSAREAENAMHALRDTHLLGRRLVLEYAAEEAVDPEHEIEKIQQKVGKQADKVALQRLTGSARKKFNVEGTEELDQG